MDHPPEGIPALSRGRHKHPSDGACLMETAARVAGEPPTDRPSCVHPLIAAVARIVNDAVSDDARQRLAPLAPVCATTATCDPQVVADLVLLVCQRALPAVLPIWAPAVRRAIRLAGRHRRDGHRAPASRWQLRRAEAAVRYATASLALTTGADRDRHLTTLLIDCLQAVEHRTDRARPARATARRLPVAAPGR
jgi:hypothetical protein